jgi:hypothetical protein
MKPSLITLLIDDDRDDQEIFSLVMREIYDKAECVLALTEFTLLKK